MACSLCRSREHNYTRCPTRPGTTRQIDLPYELAEVILRETLRPIIRASVSAPNLLETAVLSAYLQGAMDGRSPELATALDTARLDEVGKPDGV